MSRLEARCSLLLLAPLLPLWAGCTRARDRSSREQQEPAPQVTEADATTPRSAERETTPPTHASPWGEEVRGLQCRVVGPAETEQGMPLNVQVEFRSNPDHLSANVKTLNGFLPETYLTLRFKGRQAEEALVLRPYDPAHGMLAVDTGNTVSSLLGGPITPWKASFPLARLADDLVPGDYRCSVEYSYSRQRKRWWHGSEEDWEAAGFWTGKATSGEFPLVVLPKTEKTQRFLLPRRLRVEIGDEGKPKVVFSKADAEVLDFPVRNGHFIGTRTSRDGNMTSMRSGTPVPDDVNHIDWWYDYEAGVVDHTYTMEVFETADPPEHKWHPGPGSGGYKVLWKRTFRVRYP